MNPINAKECLNAEGCGFATRQCKSLVDINTPRVVCSSCGAASKPGRMCCNKGNKLLSEKVIDTNVQANGMTLDKVVGKPVVPGGGVNPPRYR